MWNFDIRLCTAAAESPWSNGPVERYNAILGLSLTKTIKESKFDAELAIAGAVSANISLKNVNGVSPDQLVVRGKKPNFLNVCHDHLPALENNTYSEVLAQNLNVLCNVRQNSMKNESPDLARFWANWWTIFSSSIKVLIDFENNIKQTNSYKSLARLFYRK